MNEVASLIELGFADKPNVWWALPTSYRAMLIAAQRQKSMIEFVYMHYDDK